MQRLSWSVLIIAVVVATAVVLATAPQLPPHVAAHFALNGIPDHWLDRDSYLALMLFLVAVMPLAGALVVAILIRNAPVLINIPNRAYWLAPERRAATVAFVTTGGLWVNAAFALFLAGVHRLVVNANEAQPPRLAAVPVGLLIAGVVTISLVTWIAIYLRFRQARADRHA